MVDACAVAEVIRGAHSLRADPHFTSPRAFDFLPKSEAQIRCTSLRVATSIHPKETV